MVRRWPEDTQRYTCDAPITGQTTAPSALCARGVLADEPVVSWMPSREALRRQITRYCAGEYWLCPLCEAVDGKYARREEESGSDHDHRPCAGDEEE